jgi:hypothetical protein
MKKSIVTALLVAAFAASSLFAMGPGASSTTTDSSAELNLSTTIAGINEMKLTVSEVTTSDFATATANGETETVSLDTDGNTLAYLSVMTNNRTGFTVGIGATALASETEGNDYVINYTLSCGDSASIDTSTQSKASVSKDSIDELSAFSYAVSVDLDDDEYNAALEDDYTATVTFSYTAD